MTRRTNTLYLIKTESKATVAIIPAKNPIDATNKYFAKIGFDSDYSYFCNRLMTTAATVDTNKNKHAYYFNTVGTKTDGDFIMISSWPVATYDAIFDQADPRDINNPLLVRPTIEEVRNCIGFRREPMYKLRKFCI